MESIFFNTIEERNTFLLDCLERGVWAEIEHSMPRLFGVRINIEKTFAEKNKGEGWNLKLGS